MCQLLRTPLGDLEVLPQGDALRIQFYIIATYTVVTRVAVTDVMMTYVFDR